jgi:hypothetical protein
MHSLSFWFREKWGKMTNFLIGFLTLQNLHGEDLKDTARKMWIIHLDILQNFAAGSNIIYYISLGQYLDVWTS